MPGPRDVESRWQELIEAVAEVIGADVSRAKGPGSELTQEYDEDGWRASWVAEDGTKRRGAELAKFDLEAWTYFELESVTRVSDYVAIVFKWREPNTPGLSYLVLHRPSPCRSVKHEAVIARTQMRLLLTPLDIVRMLQ